MTGGTWDAMQNHQTIGEYWPYREHSAALGVWTGPRGAMRSDSCALSLPAGSIWEVSLDINTHTATMFWDPLP